MYIMYHKIGLKMSKGFSENTNRRRTDNIMVKRKLIQTIVHKTILKYNRFN